MWLDTDILWGLNTGTATLLAMTGMGGCNGMVRVCRSGQNVQQQSQATLLVMTGGVWVGVG